MTASDTPDDTPDDSVGGSVTMERGMAVIRVPLREVHGLRVALAECPCKAPKSTSTAAIRQRLDRALVRLGV